MDDTRRTWDKTWDGATWRKQQGRVTFLRRSLADGEFEYRDYSLDDLEFFGDQARALASGFWDWLTEDLGCSTPTKTKKVIRKIGVRLPRRLPSRK